MLTALLFGGGVSFVVAQEYPRYLQTTYINYCQRACELDVE